MSIKDKKELVKLVSYFTMGDGGVYKQSPKSNASFIMNMRKLNLDYIEWVADVLSNITGVQYKEVPDYNTDGYNRAPLIRLWTQVHPFFNKIHDRVYTGKYKGIDPHALKLLDWEALAILYMCDGGLYVDKPNKKKGLVNPSYNVNLHMKRLSYGDLFILKKALKEKLDLEWNICKHNKYFFLRMRCKDVDKFMEGVLPYMKPSFYYKLVRQAPLNTKDDEIVCTLQ